MTRGSKCVCQTTSPHLWPLSSTCWKEKGFLSNFLSLYISPISSYYIAYPTYPSICYHSIWHYISVCVLKHISPAPTPKYIRSSYAKRPYPWCTEDETLASSDFLRIDLHLSCWRLWMMEFISIGTINITIKATSAMMIFCLKGGGWNATNKIRKSNWINTAEQPLNE